jgi:hypothetical protein
VLAAPQPALADFAAAQISKNFRPAGTTSHSEKLWIPLCANFAHLPCGHSVRPQPRPLPNHCTRTTQSGRVSYTTRSAPPAAQTPCCPQRAQALLLLLKFLHSLLFRKRGWGRAVPHRRSEPPKTRLSLHPISFQDGPGRSTVVVRQPVRSSERITGTGVRRRGSPRLTGVEPLKLALLFEVIEGTQWTWRRPPSA